MRKSDKSYHRIFLCFIIKINSRKPTYLGSILQHDTCYVFYFQSIKFILPMIWSCLNNYLFRNVAYKILIYKTHYYLLPNCYDSFQKLSKGKLILNSELFVIVHNALFYIKSKKLTVSIFNIVLIIKTLPYSWYLKYILILIYRRTHDAKQNTESNLCSAFITYISKT